MSTSDEQSPGGSAIYRHTPRERDPEIAAGDLQTTQAIEAHIARHIGSSKSVFHEIISDLVHLDVYIVAPSSEHPYYTLMTSGMSDRPMAVPEGCEEWRYAELLLCLPPSWPLREQDFKDNANYWPILWLKRLARLPHQYNTWLAPTHTVPNGDPAQPYAPNTRLCCALISQPLRFGEEALTIEANPDKTINLLSFIPIYREEMDYKLQHGCEALYDKLDSIGVSELLDVQRENTCARRSGLW